MDKMLRTYSKPICDGTKNKRVKCFNYCDRGNAERICREDDADKCRFSKIRDLNMLCEPIMETDQKFCDLGVTEC